MDERKGISPESLTIPGWSSLLPYKGVGDATVAMFGATWFFLLRGENGKPVPGGDAFTKPPWNIVLLLGGGFALAFGMQHAGASQWPGGQFHFLGGLPVATPPNAIIFGTHQAPMQAMIGAGFRLNIIMAAVVTSIVWFIRPLPAH